jgi:integrase
VGRPSNKAPVWWHPSGQWCKKRKGRFHYFGSGSLADALKRYAAEWDDIAAGRQPRPAGPVGLPLVDLVDAFLTAKRRRVESGELTAEVWHHYDRMAARVLRVLGRGREFATLTPADFGRLRADAAAAFSPTTLATFLSLARAMFNYGGELADVKVRYGDQFDPPTQRVLRVHRQQRGPRLVEAADLRRLLSRADAPLRAQILLGVNCAFGAADCSDLERGHLDGRPGWVVLPRRKTGVDRRCPLWPETTAAIRAALAARSEPRDPAHADRVFLSPTGYLCQRFVPTQGGRKGSKRDVIGRRWADLCDQVGVEVRGRFYVLRRVFRTVADETLDRVAIDLIMGHSDRSMAAAYRERVDDKRLVAVTDHVRAWIGFGKAKGKGRKGS